ncbi:MAG: SMC-Scp complex subunit ScpB [Thermoguttaceae bacterium]|nr:SMC-Scp complex subunit ScpB [Thermoguttaceae bacterium]MBQ9128045.1 SMC-Scp complex subunit ScpB [Thermoguttaceae bacterium]
MTSKNEQVGENGEKERRTVAPGRFRVVSASGTISVGGTNANGNGKNGDEGENGKNGDEGVGVASSNAPGESGASERPAQPVKPAKSGDLSFESAINSAQPAFFDGATDVSETDDEFDDENAFFASFSNGAKSRRAPDSFDAAFAGGLRSIFDAESENGEEAEDGDLDDDASDAERFQRDLERERRESLDGVLLQNDADFLREAGEKYERPRVSDADFERKSASRSGANGASNGENGRNGQNGGDGKNAGVRESDGNFNGADDGETSVEATGGRRVPIGPASILEAMLFVGDRENRPLTLARATELMRNVSETEAIEALADLNERYWRDGAPYRIVRDGDGFRMALRPEFDALAARFVGGKTKEFKLTQTMIDVLALIAYRQPISLDEILETRNNATGALSQLVKRELVAQEKRVVDKKKVAFYSTTSRFLRLFNLESLDDLPIVGDVDYR